MGNDGPSRGPTNKVDRVIEKYGLVGLGDELERRWLGESEERTSTRELADVFNRRVLEAAVEESDAFTLSGDVAQVYRSLVDDEDADETLVRARLEQSGVDIEAVTDDFVSHQTIHRYLTGHRGVERPERTDEERVEKAVRTIQRVRGRTTAVTERTVESLRRTNAVSVGEFSVLNDLQVLCESCGRSYDATDLLERGGCECDL